MYDSMYGITPNDKGVLSDYDSKSIQNAVNKAKETGINKVIIPRLNARTNTFVWNIEETVLLPDDITIILDNCILRLADGVFCNIFRNKNTYTKLGKEAEGEQKNIQIIGMGNAVLDGGLPNGLTERTSMKDGYPSVINNNFILFTNVRNFVIKDFTVSNQRWWAFNFYYCQEGYISNINVQAKDDIKNQDGIDLRSGCNNIVIENIRGQAGDDLIALTGFQGESEKNFRVKGKDIDIHTCTIRNIKGTSVSKAIVALRNQDGVKLHDIIIDGVSDTSFADEKNHPYATVRIGQNAYVTDRPSVLGETYNINVSNVHAACDTAVMLCSTLLNCSFRNIYVSGTAPCALSVNEGANIENILVDGVFYSADKYKLYAVVSKNGDIFRNDCGEKMAVFNFNNYGNEFLKAPDCSKNVIIKNVFVKKLENRPLIYATGNADIKIKNYHVSVHDNTKLFETNDGAKIEY